MSARATHYIKLAVRAVAIHLRIVAAKDACGDQTGRHRLKDRGLDSTDRSARD